MRIQKFLSNAGFCSRRKAEEYIEKGFVKINGEILKEFGHKINIKKDKVSVFDKEINLKKNKKIYIILNKPKGYVSSCIDKFERTIIDLVDIKERIYPVGRLDKDSVGLVLLTNNGDLHNKLSHPSFNHEKEYEVILNEKISDTDLKKLENGIKIENKKTRKTKIKRINEKSFFIILKEGRNRQIRKMARAIFKKVIFLKRIRIANIKIGDLKEGSYRHLNNDEKKGLLLCLKEFQRY